ncbi:MAG: hypothetical protein WCS56_02665 [Bacilli bacterium]
MIKKINIVEKILGVVSIGVIISNVILSIIFSQGANKGNIGLAIKYAFFNFKHGDIRLILIIIAILSILAFIIIWVMSSIDRKIYSFGPIYFFLFYIVIVFANGYSNVVLHGDIFLIMNLVLALLLFIDTINSLIIYGIRSSKAKGVQTK